MTAAKRTLKRDKVAPKLLTRKGTQMINSDLIQTLVIDRPNLRKNNREKIIGGDSLWRLTEAAKNPIFESGLWSKVAYANCKI